MKDDRRAKYVRRIMEEIEEFIRKRHVMELMYLDTNGEDMYYRVAPICFEEHDGNRYLLASTEDDRVLIFALEYITGVSETETMTTFSLPENLDIERFKKRFFDVGKIV